MHHREKYMIVYYSIRETSIAFREEFLKNRDLQKFKIHDNSTVHFQGHFIAFLESKS